MSLEKNTFVGSATSNLSLTVTTGTSEQASFTIQRNSGAITAATSAVNAAIIEYDGVAQQGDGTGAAGTSTAPAIAADTTMATTLAAAIAAATAAGLNALAATLGAGTDAEKKGVLDVAVAGAIADAITVNGNNPFAATSLEDGDYRIAYSDAIGAVNYNSANSVQVLQFTMAGGVMSSGHGKLSNVKTDKVTGTNASAATKITGTITFGTTAQPTNGKGYGIQVTHVSSGASAAVGTGSSSVGRVIINGGPKPLSDDFRINLTADTNAGANHAFIEFKLNDVSVAEHTTGKHADLKYLRFMWADAVTCEFKTQDIDLRGATVYDGGNKLLINRTVDFQSPVATTLFEYSAALVDTAGAVSTYASTSFASSVADNATNVENIQISGDSALGTTMKVNWTAPTFTAKTIRGYEIITQKLATGTAATNGGTGNASKFICDINHTSNAAVKIEVAALTYKTSSTTIFETTVTGLTARAKYAVWVRAYHDNNAAGAKVYGSIGLDKMGAPTYVWDIDAQDLEFDATLHSWAGSYIEDVANATGLVSTGALALFNKQDNSLDGVIDQLTGAPSDFSSNSTSIVVLNGAAVTKAVIASGSAGDTLMSTSLAIKWKDEDINFQGETGNTREMQYMCFTKENYDLGVANDYLTGYYAGTLETSASTTAVPAYHGDGWTTMVDDDGAIGTGVTAAAQYLVEATDSSTRYCRFSTGITAEDGSIATFNANGSVASGGAAVPTGRVPVITSFSVNASTDVLTIDNTTDTTLDLGEEYVFVLRLKNANGTNTPKKFGAKMVQGRASAGAFRDEDGKTGAPPSAPSLMWNPTNSKFEFKIIDQNKSGSTAVTLPIPTGAKPTDMSYDVVIDAVVQNDARDGANGVNASSDPTYTITTGKVIACASSIDTTTGVTTVSFDKVYAKAITYAVLDGDATTGAEALVSLSALYGWTFTMTLTAKNSNGSISGSAVVYNSARQVFAPKTVFAALTTDATITKPANTGSAATDDLVVFSDVRLQNVLGFDETNAGTAGVDLDLYILSADIKDLTAADFDSVGRKVDTIKYEIYQTLSDGQVRAVPNGSGNVAPTARITPAVGNTSETTGGADSMGLSMAYSQVINTFDGSTSSTVAITNEVDNRFNVYVKKSDVKFGYALKMKVSLVSAAAADLAQSPAGATLAASAVKFETTVNTLTYTNKPFENHDEVSHMSATAGDGEMTIYWSAPNMGADEMQGVAGQSVPTLEGYRIELYDMITRTSPNGNAYALVGAESTAPSSRIDALHTPSLVVTKATLTSGMTTHTITGLKNGKHYVPIIKTETLQGGTYVTSTGRTIAARIGNADSEVTPAANGVVVKYADGTDAYTAARWSSSGAADETNNVLNASTTTVIPFGTPKLLVDLGATVPTLKVDNNGRDLLFGAMLQTAPGGTNATPGDGSSARLGSAEAVGGADANVFYLDLSFNATASAGFSAASGPGAGVGAFDTGTIVAYTESGVSYPGRNVTEVNTAYLGTNWTSETNFIFASNAAGTTVGKISTASTAGSVAAFSAL